MNADFDYGDALPGGPVRGRGAGLNPANRFDSVRLHVLGEHLDECLEAMAPAARPATQVLADDSRTIINKLDPANSPDIGFRWTINPYRGCEHGCIYCYARPGHEFLGLSCGVDFETKIFAKFEAPKLLQRELGRPSWKGETIVLSGVTDPYQSVEARLAITRQCLHVLAECRQPVSIVTKSRLVLRDLDLLRRLASHGAVRVALSLTSVDAKLSALMEPRASAQADRLGAMRELSAAGVPVTAMIAPVVPGLNDHHLPRLLEAAAEAGATSASHVLLRLPHQIKALFLEWVSRHFPDRAAHVESLIRQTRGGDLYDARHGVRMRGQGPIAEQIGSMFKLYARRFGLDGRPAPLSSESFVRPNGDGQMVMF